MTTKISAMSTGTTANATDKLEIERSGTTRYITPAMIYTYILGLLSYKPGGTDVALADGGTGASLADPNADRILFWDDSAGAMTWLTVGSGLTITTTTITASGGGGSTGLLAKYELSGVQSVTNLSEAIINADTSLYDPGSDVTTGASWHYTVPTTGWYEIRLVFGYLIANGSAWQNDKYALITLFINGSNSGRLAYRRTYSVDGNSREIDMNGFATVSCTAGDTLDLRLYNETGATRKLDQLASIEVYRVS